MYRKINDFLEDWKYEAVSTVKVFSKITEEAKTTKIHANVRSLERLAWHITQTIPEMGTKAGVLHDDNLENLPIPATMAEIISIYQETSKQFLDAVASKWTDNDVEDEVPMYGDSWKKGKLLSIIIGHETHHRSQMTVIMRMLELPVPGIFGPSREEWEQMGMVALE